MIREQGVNLFRFLISLSEALDLHSRLLAQHQIRTAYVAWKIAEAAGLSASRVENVVAASLLHDIGVLSPEDKVSLHESKYDRSIETHCILGERLLMRFAEFSHLAKIVRFHHEKWHVSRQNVASTLAIDANIVCLADTVERGLNREKFVLHQVDAMIAGIRALSGIDFEPDLVDLFVSLAGRESFWLDLVSQKLHELFLEDEGFGAVALSRSSLVSVSELMRDIIDFRSPFTATHSAGVSAAGAILAEKAGFSDDDVELMRIAGNLHDLGKLAVPNGILYKPDRLQDFEFAVIRQHTYHTYSIMRRSGLEKRVTEWAAFHHEKLNGTGYPFHLRGKDLSRGSRIVAVADIFTALAEERPYRKAMATDAIVDIVEEMANGDLIDRDVVSTLKENIEEVRCATLKSQRECKNYYENQIKEM